MRRLLLLTVLPVLLPVAAGAQSSFTPAPPVKFYGSDFTFSGGAVHLAAGNSGVIRYIAGTATTDTLSHTDGLVQWNSTALADKNETLPACSTSNPSETHAVVDGKGNAQTYPIVLAPPLGTTINGTSFISLESNYGSATITCDGVSNWIVRSSAYNLPPNVVTTNAALAAASTGDFPQGVLRVDYASGRGAPPLFYAPSNSACSLNAGNGDNGSQVKSADNKCWLAQFGSSIDWREFGVSTALTDNQTPAQAALDAAFNAGLPLVICGSGFFKTSTLYFYPSRVSWCDHSAVLQRINAGPVMILVDAPGNTYPLGPMFNAHLERPTIDMNSALWTTEGGAGIVMTGVNNATILDPNIWNIPTRDTPAPAGITGAPVGTFAFTDSQGTGWAENGGIDLLGGGFVNVENIYILGGYASNLIVGTDGHPGGPECAALHGSSGLVQGIPSQDMGYGAQIAGGPGPANGNIFQGFLANCTSWGFRNDYGVQNTYINTDATHSEFVGYAMGTYGRYDVQITGTGDIIGEATTLAANINANAALAAYGVTAGVYPGTSTLWVSWGDEHSTTHGDPPLNLALCGANTNPVCGTNTGITFRSPSITGAPVYVSAPGSFTIKVFYRAAGNHLYDYSSEDDGDTAVSIAANATSTILENPVQTSGSPKQIISNHAGPDGSVGTVVRDNLNAFNYGTQINSSQTIDCNADYQPYAVDTGPGPVTLTIGNWSASTGNTCSFIDAGSGGGSFGTNALTIQAGNSAYGNYTVKGSTLVLGTNGQSATLHLLSLNNNSLGANSGSNAGGDWR